MNNSVIGHLITFSKHLINLPSQKLLHVIPLQKSERFVRARDSGQRYRQNFNASPVDFLYPICLFII